MSIATAITNLSSRIQTAYDTIQSKGGTIPAQKDTYHLSSAIDSIPSGGGNPNTILRKRLNGELTEVIDNDLTGRIFPYGLYGLTSLTSAQFDKCASFGDYSFADCTALKKVAFDTSKAVNTNVYIGQNAFRGTNGLSVIDTAPVSQRKRLSINQNAFNGISCDILDFKTGITISHYAFQHTSCYTPPDFTSVQNVYVSAFTNSRGLANSLNFPQLTTIWNSAFLSSDLSGDISCDFKPIDNTTYTPSYAFAYTNIKSFHSNASFTTNSARSFIRMFYYCKELTSVSIPNWMFHSATTNTAQFLHCEKLEHIDCRNLRYINNLSFQYCGIQTAQGFSLRCDNLVSLHGTSLSYSKPHILDFSRCTSVPTMTSTTWLNGSADKTNLQIWVPPSLYDSWKSATNWAQAADYIIAHEPED